MKESKFVKVALVILMVLLTVDIGGRLLFSPSEVVAGGKVQYKVVSTTKMKINTPAQYEKLLNAMSNQGWTFNHAFGRGDWQTFKR